MIDIATVGWLTMDDIVLLDHTCRRWRALFSHRRPDLGRRVGVHSVTGREVYEDVHARIASRGLDAEGVGIIEGAGLQLWLLHETETFKRQVPKLNSATADDMDRGRGPLPETYRGARGFHVAPQSPAGTAENVRALSNLPHGPIVTVDILSDEYIDRRLNADLAFVHGASAFLPSEQEIMRIWDPPDIAIWLRETALRVKCHMVAKLGERGIPRLRCRERCLDPHTGAPGQCRRYDWGWRRLLRRVRRGSRGRPAARRMRCDGNRGGVLCYRSLWSARNATAQRCRSSSAPAARAGGDQI
jgi:hypothetical protein